MNKFKHVFEEKYKYEVYNLKNKYLKQKNIYNIF